ALLAALINGLQVAGKRLEDATVVIAGVGPTGIATARLLVAAGAGQIVATDRKGAVFAGRDGVEGEAAWVAEHPNPDRTGGTGREVVRGADAFIGLSTPGLVSADDVRGMAADSVVLALAMPTPEISAAEVTGIARVYGSGRPETPNQINSTLAFPGIWRGA